ncbi:MAG: VWA domain-containing protein [Candidatus Micrarchaeota archaeon]
MKIENGATKKGRRRGIAFTLDAIIALLIVFSAIPIILLLTTATNEHQTAMSMLHLQAEDAIDTLSKMQVGQVRNEPVMQDLFNRGVLTDEDLNETVLDILGGLWATQESDELADAANITKELLGPLLPADFKWSFSIEGDLVYNSTMLEDAYSVSVSRKAASGFARNKSSSGYVARAFLENIIGKEDSSYFYFGGYVGNGEIIATIRDVPVNSTFARMYIELNAGSNFTLYINGIQCQTMEVNTGGFEANNWTITNVACLDDLVAGGANNITFDFDGTNLSKKYIGGGFVRVVYSTDQFITEPMPKYYFPGTDGAINIYDSFYVIGAITNMSARLHYKTELQTFMAIGNATVYENYANESYTDYDIILDDAFISNALAAAGLNYSDLSSRTVPLRFGHRESNFTNGTGLVDTVLATTESGTMLYCDIINGTNFAVCGGGGNITRLAAARDSDKAFADVILGAGGGNRVANIAYHSNAPHASNLQELTSDLALVNAAIDKITGTGESKRCYACAIDEARRRLIPASSSVPPGALPPTGPGSNYSKVRAVVLMDDGLKFGASNDYYCDNKDDLVGNYIQPCGMADAKKQAIDQACAMNQPPYSVGGNNITIFTIGFGPDSDNSMLSSIANCTGGKFYKSSNYTELMEIYEEIANEIRKTVTYVQQSVIVEGSNSTMYPDSYLDFLYQSSVPVPGYKEISVNTLTNTFPGCTGTFQITGTAYLTDAKLVSYSGDFWTSRADVNSSLTGGYQNVFNLSEWGSKFISLGDPFHSYLPINLLKVNETNGVYEEVSSNSSSISPSCSTHNRVIYSGRLKASTFYSSVFPNIIGRNVTVYYDSNGDGIADGYSYIAVGVNLSNFDPNPIAVEALDPTNFALDAAFLELLSQLNYYVGPGNSGWAGSQTNPIDLIIGEDIGVASDMLSLVPIPWGPSEMSITVWV